ncbi:unnamed protein product [Caenorhabditis nigoni]
MRQLILVALFVSTASSLPFIGSVQSVRVTGKVTCNGSPAENIKVKLYEKEILLDKLLDERSTDTRGSFTLAGSKKELTAIDPHVNIYHKCNYKGPIGCVSHGTSRFFHITNCCFPGSLCFTSLRLDSPSPKLSGGNASAPHRTPDDDAASSPHLTWRRQSGGKPRTIKGELSLIREEIRL